jgi:transposase
LNNEPLTAKLFESALGISDPWFFASIEFDETAKTLTVLIDFKAGHRFCVAGHEGEVDPGFETAV